LADRLEIEPAAKLLTEALDKEPSAELTDKIRLRQGALFAAKGNAKAALAQFDAIARNAKNPLYGWANYGAGEVLMQTKQYPEAIQRLALFRDQQPLQNQPGLTDRALLRLGHAYAEVKDWNASRQALERLVNSFGNGPWNDEGRYGLAWSLQQQKNYDGAVGMYTQVTTRTARPVAAKAQLQIGICRLEQKRYPEAADALLAVPLNHDSPELSAIALLEAARAYVENNQKDQAQSVLRRIIREFPDTPSAATAKEKLADKKFN
jgi:TolA-binding protein